MSETISTASMWSIMAVEKRDADIYSFNYSYVDSDGKTKTYNSSANNTYFTSVMMNKEYNSYAFNNTSASSAYTYLCGYDDVFVFRGHGAPGLIGFRNSAGEFNGRIAADSAVSGHSANRYISSCEENELSSLKCVLYLGCNTGVNKVVSGYTYNLVTSTYNKGAHFVLGTTETVVVSASNNFLKGFVSGVSSDKRILECIQEGIETAGIDSTGRTYPIIYVGDIYQYLVY